MKKLLIVGALMAGLASPAIAKTSEVAAKSPTSAQSVYRTERTIEVMNWDGSVTETTIVTVYYVFGYE